MPTTTACVPFKCENGGSFNNKTCRCDCFPSYSGSRCENLVCSPDPSDCNYSTKDCVVSLIRNYCPNLCGMCPLSGPNSTNATQCENVSCFNGGSINMSTCKCNCFKNYNGDRCENLVCDVDEPTDCNFSSSYCLVSLISDYCPKLCGKCSNRTNSSQTDSLAANDTLSENSNSSITETSIELSQNATEIFSSNNQTNSNASLAEGDLSCVEAKCQNGGTFSAFTCECICIDNFLLFE
jgi:hypothetical protein